MAESDDTVRFCPVATQFRRLVPKVLVEIQPVQSQNFIGLASEALS
jgi:hypothetical protein